MSIKIDWIVLDAWGVIFEIRNFVADILIPYIHKFKQKITDDTIYKIYLQGSIGEISSKKFWYKIGLGTNYPEIEQNYLKGISCFDNSLINIVKKLRKKYKLAVLSNDVKEWSNDLFKKFDISRFFDTKIISGAVGARKPDKEIYQILLKRINCEAKRCIFIDDKLSNLNIASKLDFNTIRFIRKKEKIPFCSEFEVGSFNELYQVISNFYE